MTSSIRSNVCHIPLGIFKLQLDPSSAVRGIRILITSFGSTWVNSSMKCWMRVLWNYDELNDTIESFAGPALGSVTIQ